MKICFLGWENLPVLAPEFNAHAVGGEQVQQTLLARALTRRGHQVSMVVLDYGQNDGAAWHGVTTYKAYRADAGIPVLRYVHPRWTGVWAALARADADLYYTSCAGWHLGLLALFCRQAGRKFVYRVAHDTDCDPDGLMIRFWRDRMLYEYGLQRAQGILAQSRQQQHAIHSNYGLRSEVADMLVDPPEPPAGNAGRDVDVLWVNNLRPFKRPELLPELAAALPALRFAMVGGVSPGNEGLFDAVRRQAADLPNLRFHGRKPYHDIGPFFGRARLLVNTSDSEGFPNSYLQAWIRGTPVVAFFDPDNLIRRERLGAVAKSLPDMAQAISALLEDPPMWHETSRRCAGYMERIYGEERILEPYLNLFRRLIPEVA